ncbi:hypothetical protein C8R45DRAFT_475644 [Mycena sanguinolenta]|nr:hypothetical protein C8R45DRAFT_475644 [Mycena sanguinolenta]
MSSATSLIALAVLGNPRLIPKTKTVIFDGQIYLGSSVPAIFVSLRYFNATDIQFLDVGCYSVVIHPARTFPTVEVYSQSLTPVDYHTFGDIVSIVPLGSPENFDLQHHAVVHVCGMPSNIDKKNSVFEIHAEQYLNATKTTDNVFPVQCLFPQTLRWENFKPVPGKVNDGIPAHLKFTGFFEDSRDDEPKVKKRKLTDDRTQQSQEDKGEGTSTGRPSRGTKH